MTYIKESDFCNSKMLTAKKTHKNFVFLNISTCDVLK